MIRAGNGIPSELFRLAEELSLPGTEEHLVELLPYHAELMDHAHHLAQTRAGRNCVVTRPTPQNYASEGIAEFHVTRGARPDSCVPSVLAQFRRDDYVTLGEDRQVWVVVMALHNTFFVGGEWLLRRGGCLTVWDPRRFSVLILDGSTEYQELPCQGLGERQYFVVSLSAALATPRSS